MAKHIGKVFRIKNSSCSSFKSFSHRDGKSSSKQNQKKKSNSDKNSGQKQETFPHFRHYHLSGHPALIVGEHSESEYKFRKVMHSDRDGRHLNEVVTPNPNKRDKEPMYIAKRVRHDKKNHFGKKYSWKYLKK
ncbi:MAG: hypothetical protein J6D15_03845 [Clostridia bacterium]|nr:hypothetical protein [Clostridia bacterium]